MLPNKALHRRMPQDSTASRTQAQKLKQKLPDDLGDLPLIQPECKLPILAEVTLEVQ